eukprot:549456_1
MNVSEENELEKVESVEKDIERWSSAFIHMTWNIILIVYTQITSTMVKLIDCRPLGNDIVMFYHGTVHCYDEIHGICFFVLFLCFCFPMYLFWKMNYDRKRYGAGYMRRQHVILGTYVFAKDFWWYLPFSATRRFIIICLASMPVERPDFSATVLALFVGACFIFQVKRQPMHFQADNYGEMYVWFIALVLSILNINPVLSVPMQWMMRGLIIILPLPLLFQSKGFYQTMVPYYVKLNAVMYGDSHSYSELQIDNLEVDKKSEQDVDSETDEQNTHELVTKFELCNKWTVSVNKKCEEKSRPLISFMKDDKFKRTESVLCQIPLYKFDEILDSWLRSEHMHMIHTIPEAPENSISSDEKEIYTQEVMQGLLHEMLENEDVVIFSPDELNQITQIEDEIESKQNQEQLMENKDIICTISNENNVGFDVDTLFLDAFDTTNEEKDEIIHTKDTAVMSNNQENNIENESTHLIHPSEYETKEVNEVANTYENSMSQSNQRSKRHSVQLLIDKCIVVGGNMYFNVSLKNHLSFNDSKYNKSYKQLIQGLDMSDSEQ